MNSVYHIVQTNPFTLLTQDFRRYLIDLWKDLPVNILVPEGSLASLLFTYLHLLSWICQFFVSVKRELVHPVYLTKSINIILNLR